MFKTPLKMLVAAAAMAALLDGPRAFADSPPSLPLPSGNSAVDASAVPGFPSLYQGKVIKRCPASTQCVAPFARVPNNRLLRATNTNCLGIASGNDQVTFVLVTALDEPFDYFVVRSDDQFRSSINGTILSFFEAGTRPRIVLAADNSTSLELVCKLTGTLLTPQPQVQIRSVSRLHRVQLGVLPCRQRTDLRSWRGAAELSAWDKASAGNH